MDHSLEDLIVNYKYTSSAKEALDQWLSEQILAGVPKEQTLAYAGENFPHTPGTLHKYYQIARSKIHKTLTPDARAAITGAVLDNFFDMVEVALSEEQVAIDAAKSLEGKERVAASATIVSIRDRLNAAGAKILTATRDNSVTINTGEKFDPADLAQKLAESRQ